MTFDPLLPLPALAAMVVAGVVLVVLWVRRETPPRLSVMRWSAMGLLLLVIAVDPTISGGRAAIKRSDANVLFVVDTTGSMAAQDYGGGQPRLVGVRHDITALADEFSGAHFALITFNSKTRVILPWTTDRLALDSATELLRQEWTSYAQGTRLDEPLPTMRSLLPRAEGGDGYDIVFYLSDGEQTTGARGAIVRCPRQRVGGRCRARLRHDGGRPDVRVRRPRRGAPAIHPRLRDRR